MTAAAAARPVLILLALFAALFAAAPAPAQPNPETAAAIRQAMVKVRAFVAGEARTARTLGTEREGTGIVIDADGLIVTIGYVILEAMGVEITDHRGRAMRAEIVGYDADTGFGLLRATEPLDVRPAPMGRAARLAEGERVTLVAAGEDGAQPAIVVQRREFAGYWEYLLEEAVFVSPPHPRWAGAGLFTADGRLVAIGSLLVGQVAPGMPVPGNMMIPIDLLRPILGDLLALGRMATPSRPWLGVNVQEAPTGVVITRVQQETPAERAGLRPGDVVVGVAGEPVRNVADFYRKLWSKGDAGVAIGLEVVASTGTRQVTVTSGDRRRYMRTGQSY
ncbi:S1C family serine protease [Stella sp.]|uniref:S1C family serine protease n=1 Tax=Stella sp. TaxID=2912054 RepID=UPI0035AE2AB9